MNDAETVRHMNAAQIARIEKQAQEMLTRAIDDYEVRKLALEIAVKLAPLGGLPSDTMKAVEEIYEFLTKPFNNVVVRIET